MGIGRLLSASAKPFGRRFTEDAKEGRGQASLARRAERLPPAEPVLDAQIGIGRRSEPARLVPDAAPGGGSNLVGSPAPDPAPPPRIAVEPPPVVVPPSDLEGDVPPASDDPMGVADDGMAMRRVESALCRELRAGVEAPAPADIEADDADEDDDDAGPDQSIAPLADLDEEIIAPVDDAAAAPASLIEPEIDELDDVAVAIGRVVSMRGTVVWGSLFDDGNDMAARAARMGALVSIDGTDSRVFGVVNSLKRERQAAATDSERTFFEIQILGEISTVSAETEAQGFQRGVSSYPPLGARITTVTLRDLAKVHARPRASNIHIGQLRRNRKVPTYVMTDSLLGKHFAVLGTTGAGKSCAVTVILRSILDEHPNGHIVLLDPHNEYPSAFADKAELLNPANLKLPYWLLNFEEIGHVVIGDASARRNLAQAAILKEAIVTAKKMFAGTTEGGDYITVDTPVPYSLSALIDALKNGMGVLNKADGAGPYLSLIARIEGLRADRRYGFMFSSLTVRDNMRQILAQLLRVPVDGKPITIIDLSGVPSEVVDVVVSVLFRVVFELAMWSDRGASPPVLLVCEEAHRYVPSDEAAGFNPTRRVISRIAKEGRKYGVSLCLVSQRPSEVAISSLAQCNTVFALRLTNEHDQAFVARALPENAGWLVDALPSLNTQEAIVVGDGVTVPVQFRFKDLPADRRPSSSDPSFETSWREECDPEFLDRAIDRWRLQMR